MLEEQVVRRRCPIYALDSSDLSHRLRGLEDESNAGAIDEEDECRISNAEDMAGGWDDGSRK